MKDSFVGALGKLNNHGGSRIYTTPNTTLVPPVYEIDVNVPNGYNFLASDLSGRLWIYYNGDNLYIIALKWDKGSEKLELANTALVSKTNIGNSPSYQDNGINWISLTYYLIEYLDEMPYFRFSILKNSSNKNYMLRFLPKINGRRFIGQISIYTDNTGEVLQEDFITLYRIIEDGKTNYYIDEENDYHLFVFNNQVWALCPLGIGRVCWASSLIWLHLNPDNQDGIKKPPVLLIWIFKKWDKPDWDQPNKINIILCDNDKVYMCSRQRYENKDSYKGLCFRPSTFYTTTTSIFNDDTYIDLPVSKEFIWNHNYIIDIITNKKIELSNNTLIYSDTIIDCKNISQWIAPYCSKNYIFTYWEESLYYLFSDDIIVTSDNCTDSSFNKVYVIYVNSGFYREVFTNKNLPLTALSYEKSDGINVRLSMGFNKNKNKIQINELITPKVDFIENLSIPVMQYVVVINNEGVFPTPIYPFRGEYK